MKRSRVYLANIIPCLWYGLVCGVLTGGAIFFFKLAAKKLEELSHFLYTSAKASPLYIIFVFAGLFAFAFVMSFIHKKVPEAKGGGIPRSEGVLKGILSFRWLRTLIGTAVGSMISFFCGLPLGSEGPAVLIGTSLGGFTGTFSGKKSAWNRYIMTGGAGAGFAVAMGAPLSAMLFALEEIHKRFTPMLVLIVSVSVISATFINNALASIFGVGTSLLEIGQLGTFMLNDAWFLLVLGAVIAIAVALFDKSIELFSRVTKKMSKVLSSNVKLIVLFLFVGVLGFVFIDAIYSGHDIILHMLSDNVTVSYIVILRVLRVFMMLMATDSGATGGIFIPTLAIGALVSALAVKLLTAMGMPLELYSAVVLLGMCAFIGGTLRAPFTATVLFIELTGQFTSLFYVVLVVFTVSFIVEMVHQTSFYDRVVEDMEERQNHGKEAHIAYFEMTVSNDAFVVEKSVRDIMWPASSVVVGIRRNENNNDIDHDGERRLYAGDAIIMRVKFFDEDELKNQLYDLVGREYEIIRVGKGK